MGHTSNREPAGTMWVFLGARRSGDGAGGIGRRAVSGAGSPDWQCGEALELAVPVQELGVAHSAINHCVTSNPKYTTTKIELLPLSVLPDAVQLGVKMVEDSGGVLKWEWDWCLETNPNMR